VVSRDKKSKEQVGLNDLMFYFDSQAKDRMDTGAYGRRSGQVLALRERLLSLPEGEFDMAIKTIGKLVDNGGRGSNQSSDELSLRQRNARALYEKVEQTQASGASAEEISKI